MYGLSSLGRTVYEDSVCRASFAGGFFRPSCWSALEVSPLAPPGAPPVELWRVPPASGEEAQATVDALLNQQAEDQKALNAAGVSSSWVDRISSGVVSAPGGVSWLMWGALGLGVFALVAVSGGSPRRYGR